MKLVALLLPALVLVLPGCKSQTHKDAKKLSDQIQAAEKNSSGNVATTETAYFMKARIDGKAWQATSMLPDDNNDSRRIQGEDDNGESIGFYIWMRGLEAGLKRKFSEGNAADLEILNGDTPLWGGRKGEMTITSINDQVMEGSFHFTATSHGSEKTIEVTDGYFRFPFAKKGK